jgi:lipopolysaccharide export system permease protein
MRLLDRYLLRELLTPLAYCLSGFLIFWITFDVSSDLEAFQEEKLRFMDLAEYYLYRLPEFLVIVLPVALLLALLYALTNHARHHEITAIRAAGVSLARVCVPYLGVGLLFSLTLYLLSERWLPDSSDRADRIRKRHVSSGSEAARNWRNDLKFRNDRDDRFWRIRAFNIETGEMRQPYVEWRSTNGTRLQLYAEQGIWTNGQWTFLSVRRSIPASQPDAIAVWQPTNEFAVAEFTETPEQIRSEIKVSQLSASRAAKRPQLTVSEIQNYKRLHPELRRQDRAILDTQLHARLAAPWTCLIVVLIAIPFGAASGRRNVFVGVASSILICFTYYVLRQFSLAMGTGGYGPAALAAWLPNAAFGTAGFWLTLRAR